MSETQVTEESILRALATIVEQQARKDIVALGLIRDVKVCDGNVAFSLVLADPGAPSARMLAEACRQAVLTVPGVTHIEVRPVQAGTSTADPSPTTRLLPGVRYVIAVGSGKGGVGKSTVAVNLAVALALAGARTGLLDADVYGPSIPMMMGVRRQPVIRAGKIVPLEQHGVRLMSLGFLMPDDSSHVIWRGPMVGGAVRQMLADCDWGELDYLLVDLPPGTGDAQLTLAQSVPLTGAIVVMTSQDVAVNIAAKAVGMFRRLDVPILGVVGNMDTFICPHCGVGTAIFSGGGSEAAAARLGTEFLGSVPLDPSTVAHGDQGVPTVLAAPESGQAQAFRTIAGALQAAVERLAPAPEDPLSGLRRQLGRE